MRSYISHVVSVMACIADVNTRLCRRCVVWIHFAQLLQGCNSAGLLAHGYVSVQLLWGIEIEGCPITHRANHGRLIALTLHRVDVRVCNLLACITAEPLPVLVWGPGN
jgi:hypothetical protein